ncbi:hypothetical protein EBR21_03630 [bacterium]|nr:hypothetical protein [bacterium]
MIRNASLIIAALAISGCMQRKFNNQGALKEAVGKFNSAESLGLSENALDWNSIRNEVKGERPKAWSDTWWPHYAKGIADRYILRSSGKRSENLSGRGGVPGKFVEQYLDAVAKADPKELALLSPAEKYDYLMAKKSIPEGLRTKLAEQSKTYSGSKAESILLSLEDKLEKLGQYDDTYKTLNSEYAREANGNAAAFRPLLKDGSKLNDEMKKFLPLTSHDWTLWLDTFSWAHDEEWAWMGICNGWSPAALREQKPLQSVLVSKGNKKILFTEGDIRGLLSWVWGWQFPSETLGAGVRCDASESRTLVKDNRIIDGRLCEGNGSRPGHCVAANTIYVDKDNPFSPVPGRTIRFGLDPQNRKTHEAKLKSSLSNAYYEADVSNLSSGEMRTLLIQVTKSCRDMNAGLFHAALVDLVARRKTGFVVDADRYTQVWNQPVYAYDMTYLPILKKDGSTSPAGIPVAVNDVLNDPYSEFRAEKTSSIVQVRAKVIYASENGPFAKYDPSGSQETHEELIADYTIEISKKGKIVGGEWGLLPGTPGVKPLEASNSTAAVAPDFIWDYPEKSKPEGELVDYATLKKIHECSLKPSSNGQFDLSPFVQNPLPYVECSLD